MLQAGQRSLLNHCVTSVLSSFNILLKINILNTIVNGSFLLYVNTSLSLIVSVLLSRPGRFKSSPWPLLQAIIAAIYITPIVYQALHQGPGCLYWPSKYPHVVSLMTHQEGTLEKAGTFKEWKCLNGRFLVRGSGLIFSSNPVLLTTVTRW